MPLDADNHGSRPAPGPDGFDDWLNRGGGLADATRRALWDFADWAAEGASRFPKCLAGKPDVSPFDVRHIRKMARLAEAFPSANRSDAISFEAYAAIARLAAEDRPALLAQAIADRWTAREAGSRVAQHRQEHAAFTDDDPERAVTHFYRLWNNLPADLREHAAPRVQHAIAGGYSLIDEEEAI